MGWMRSLAVADPEWVEDMITIFIPRAYYAEQVPELSS